MRQERSNRLVSYAFTALGGAAISSLAHTYKRRQRDALAREAIYMAELRTRRAEEAGKTAKKEAERDLLTGLRNRRGGELEYNRLAARNRDNPNSAQSIIWLDLDDFKNINDTYGHGSGDEALQSTAHILEENARPGDIPIRISGDEMAVILPRTSETGALIAAERYREAIAADGHTHASFGVAELDLSLSFGQNLERVDRPLYVAKNGGGDQVVAYSSLGS